ncbi:MAG: hypothetical protein FJ293_04115 [Planctomycetes bacterium]|nr:hypothetical protein [Planctomycetota bacterium]
MRMIVASLIGAAAIGFGYEKLIQPSIESAVPDSWQPLAVAIGAAFLGSLFGWIAKGIFVKKV